MPPSVAALEFILEVLELVHLKPWKGRRDLLGPFICGSLLEESFLLLVTFHTYTIGFRFHNSAHIDTGII